MIIIIGGKSHGKKSFIDEFNIDNLVINNYHLQIDSHSNFLEYTKENISFLNNRVIIVEEVGLGIVPLESKLRYERDELGRVYQYLCNHSDIVVRVWYGLPIFIKGTENEFKNEITRMRGCLWRRNMSF